MSLITTIDVLSKSFWSNVENLHLYQLKEFESWKELGQMDSRCTKWKVGIVGYVSMN